MNDKLAGLSPAKRALLDKMIQQRSQAGDPREQPIPKRPPGEAVPLSYNQEILWVLDQLMPGSTAYNVPRAMRIHGDLDVDALGRALDTIVARHEVIRTTYKDVAGTPIQVINAPSRVDLEICDLRTFPDADREAEAQRILVAGARYGFDLSRDLMIRASLLKMGEREHILLILTHHIAADGWSKAILLGELTALYDAYAQRKPSPLPEAPIQYADYAVWQRRACRGDLLGRQIAYWKKQLAGAPALIELPLDHPRPPVQSHRGLRQTLLIPRPLVDALRAIGQREGATLFMVLLAAFQTLIFRYTHQDDVVVGTPIAGRNRGDIEGIIGFFTNTLVMRADLSGDPTFREVIRRVREVALGAYDHQDLPFEKLVMELKPDRALSHAPLFQVMFVLQNNPQADRPPEGITMTPIKIERGDAKFDLLLSLTEHPEGLTGSLEYATDLFEAATITRLRGHLRTLLEAIARNPDEKIAAIPMLTEGERHQILVGWNQTKAETPTDRCLHALVEAQVDRTPDAIAVIAADGARITYRDLDARSNQLANYLQMRGVGPEVKVGIAVDRSIEMVIGLLGILKAGGACLPLDPAYPMERLAIMIDDGDIPVLVTQDRLAASIPPSRAEVVRLDADRDKIAKESVIRPASGVRPCDSGYVIFTSGSTGKPKGVVLIHAGLVNFCAGAVERYGVTSADRVLQFASMSFDAHIEELYPALMTGATIVLRDDEMIASFTSFSRSIGDLAITVLDLPTAYWHAWVRDLVSAGVALPDRLRAVIVGGEQAQAAAYAAWRKIPGADRVRWFNTAAPTECTVVAAVYEDDPREGEITADPPIGRPMANTTSYILDSHLNPVPIGVSGEWVIGGAGVARGYLNRPDQTAKAFIRDPFSDAPGARLYRTGDRARALPDGNIVLLGRLDHQVKIRGFRVELGEIEAALGAHPAIAQSLVVAREDASGEKNLVGYVVIREGQRAAVGEIRIFLKERLPEFMIPSAVVAIEAIPRTANGKVDRAALPAPDRSAAAPAKEVVAPRTDVERRLAAIWEEVLGISRVGVTDNFFDLGGHSMLAFRAIQRVEETCGERIPLAVFFENQTIAELARVLTPPDRAPRPGAIRGAIVGTRDYLLARIESYSNRLWRRPAERR